MILATPALCLFPFRRSSPAAAGYWLAFWTAAFIAFAIHFYWAVFVFFKGSWTAIRKSTRVSAPVIDTVFAVLWAADVLLAWSGRAEDLFVEIIRIGAYVLAIVLFVLGSAKEGEIPLSRALGFAMAGAVACSLVAWLVVR